MSEQELTPQEVFLNGMQEAEAEVAETVDTEVEETTEVEAETAEEETIAEAESIELDHAPNDDDSDEYWREFAKSKGWSDDKEKVKEGYFTDYKAFVRGYDRLQDAKLSKSEVKELKKTIEEVAKQQGELTRAQKDRHNREVEALKGQLEQQKAKAKDDLDFDAYEKVDKEIKALEEKTEPKQEAKPQGEHQFFVDYRSEHPELLKGGEDFDATLDKLMLVEVNDALNTGQVKTEGDLKTFMDNKLDELKSSMVRYQPKPARKPPATASAKNTPKAKADAGRLDADERQYYDHLKKKGMATAAEAFLKSSLGA